MRRQVPTPSAVIQRFEHIYEVDPGEDDDHRAAGNARLGHHAHR